MAESNAEGLDWWTSEQLANLRGERKVNPAFDIRPGFHATYLSLHNVEPYWERLYPMFRQLDLADSSVFIAHNGGPAFDLHLMNKLAEAASVKVHTIINPPGLNGYAGLMMNMDILGQFEWVTTLHQDDVYQPDHIQESIMAAKVSPKTVGMIYGELRSRNLEWRSISNPRAHWFLENYDSLILFETSISHHPFPFSGATFRTKVLEDYRASLHSVAFQDTEICLKMSRDWSFSHCKKLVVQYLENPSSESHALQSFEWQRDATDALIRVMNSGTLDSALKNTPHSDRERLLSRIERSAQLRISSPPDKDRLIAHVKAKILSDAPGALNTTANEQNEVASEAMLHTEKSPAFRFRFNRFRPNANVSTSVSLALRATLARLPDNVQKFIWMRLLSGRIGRLFFPSWYLLAERCNHVRASSRELRS